MNVSQILTIIGLMITVSIVMVMVPVQAQLNILTCDRLLLSGMNDCLKKYAPTNDNDPCCAYRKFRACNAGLKSGLRIAGQRAGCSTSFLAQANINSLADRLTGVTLSNCKDAKQACRKSGSPSTSSSSTSSKPKRPSRPKTPKISDNDQLPIARQTSFLGDTFASPLDSIMNAGSSFLPQSSSSRGDSGLFGSRRRPSILGGGNESPLTSFLGRGSLRSGRQDVLSSMLNGIPI